MSTRERLERKSRSDTIFWTSSMAMVYISRTTPDLSSLFRVERVFFRWHNSGHLFFRLGRMHEYLVRRVVIAQAQILRQESTNASFNQRPKTIRSPLRLLLDSDFTSSSSSTISSASRTETESAIESTNRASWSICVFFFRISRSICMPTSSLPKRT